MKISIPSKSEILTDSISVNTVPKGGSWYQRCLGGLAPEKGVYVIHHGGSIKYIGKTNGESMSFGMRLQETAAGQKHTYPK